MGIGKGLVIVILVMVSVVEASAHPGKTDVRGGHKCWKGCRQWELYHGEYHLHDKDFKPIRIARPETDRVVAAPEPAAAEPAASEPPPERPPEPVVQPLPTPARPQPVAALPPAEESMFPLGAYITGLLAGLLMLMVLLIAVKKKQRRR